MASASQHDVFEPGLDTGRLADAARARRHRRIDVRLPVVIRLQGKPARKAILTDLSVRGCAVNVVGGVLIGDGAELRIPHIGLVRGRVARLTPGGLGIALAGNRLDRQARADALMMILNEHDWDAPDRPIRLPAPPGTGA